jgi:hypothetical protein
MMNDYTVEVFVGGRPYSLEVALTNHEKGKLIKRALDGIYEKRKLYPGEYDGEITILVNGEEYKEHTKFHVDVKKAAKHMKTQWIENKIMDD